MKTAFGILFTLTVFLISARGVSAASTSLEVSPSNGLFSSPFTIKIEIDGHGDVFNAAKAKIILSKNVSVQSILKGDCHFAFLHEPTVDDLSFEGVILGSSAKKCTVYNLALNPVENGTAFFEIQHASVRRYGDAAEILSVIKPGKYQILLEQKVSSQPSPSPTFTVLSPTDLSSSPATSPKEMHFSKNGVSNFTNLFFLSGLCLSVILFILGACLFKLIQKILQKP